MRRALALQGQGHERERPPHVVADGHSRTGGPSARASMAMGYDAIRNHVVLFGGLDSATVFDDTWIYDGAWHRVAFRPAEGDGVVAISGQNPVGFGVVDDTWILTWSSEGTSESCVSPIDADGDALALCDDPDCWPVCTPLCPPATS